MDTRTNGRLSHYELVVVRAHVAARRTVYERVYVSTYMSVADLFANYGKPLAGVRRVDSVKAITPRQYREARMAGEHCFHARPRQTPTEQLLGQIEHEARMLRRRDRRARRLYGTT